MKNLLFLFLFLIIITACQEDNQTMEEVTWCMVCDYFPGNYKTDVTYGDWFNEYDNSGEFVQKVYKDSLTSENELEVILIDYDTKKFQLNGLFFSRFVDIPASYNEETKKLEFQHYLDFRDYSNYLELRGTAEIIGDDIYIESIYKHRAYFFGGPKYYESFITEIGEKE